MEKEISIKCYCSEERCKGNLYIQPDILNGEKVFVVSITDISGYTTSSMVLSFKQLRQLRKDISTLFSELATRD